MDGLTRFRPAPPVACLLAALALASCGGGDLGGKTAGANPGVGPFDENGNYVEAWADNPPANKRRAPRRSNPTPEPTPSRTLIAQRAKQEKQKAREELLKKQRLDELERAKTRREREQEEFDRYLARYNAQQQPTVNGTRTVVATRQSAGAPRPLSELSDPSRVPPVIRNPAPAPPRPKVTPPAPPRAKSKPPVKKAPTEAKARPKAEPMPKAIAAKDRTHRVQSKDTLYALSRRYNTSVSAIKKANGLSSNTIQTGRTLRIPR